MSKNTLIRSVTCTVLATILYLSPAISLNAAQTETEPKETRDKKYISLNAQTGTLTEHVSHNKPVVKPIKKILISQRQEVPNAVIRKRSNQFEYENRVKREINEWALGLAAGKLIDTPVKMASELSSILDDGKNLHVIPMVTRGASSNIHALLYMRGVDLAIINSDSLAHYKKENNIPNLASRINYITQLYLSELHVIARPGINSLEDLKGKVVNFNTRGTAGAFSGPMIFSRLGVNVKEKFISNDVALQQMKESQEIAAVVYVTGKPVNTLHNAKWPKGFRLLPVNYSTKLTDHYLPTSLSSKDYPGLISEGGRVPTVAVPTLLAVYNWKTTSKRYLKVERFIQYMLKRWKTFQKPPFHQKWRNINLNAKIPGWKRFPAMQDQLDLMARLNRDSALKKKTASAADVESDKKLKKAFDRFLRNYARANGLSGFTQQQRDKLFRQFHKFWRETGR